jgi:hypothetical protein
VQVDEAGVGGREGGRGGRRGRRGRGREGGLGERAKEEGAGQALTADVRAGPKREDVEGMGGWGGKGGGRSGGKEGRGKPGCRQEKVGVVRRTLGEGEKLGEDDAEQSAFS